MDTLTLLADRFSHIGDHREVTTGFATPRTPSPGAFGPDKITFGDRQSGLNDIKH